MVDLQSAQKRPKMTRMQSQNPSARDGRMILHRDRSGTATRRRLRPCALLWIKRAKLPFARRRQDPLRRPPWDERSEYRVLYLVEQRAQRDVSLRPD